ncbi:hypothetical protein HH297_16815 [Xanthomonas sp. Kuri4-3]
MAAERSAERSEVGLVDSLLPSLYFTMNRCAVGSAPRPDRLTSPANALLTSNSDVTAETPKTTNAREREPCET